MWWIALLLFLCWPKQIIGLAIIITPLLAGVLAAGTVYKNFPSVAPLVAFGVIWLVGWIYWRLSIFAFGSTSSGSPSVNESK